jgi:xanthine dehydrogenase iron-sulfur cluster and FAD-binding subunit A
VRHHHRQRRRLSGEAIGATPAGAKKAWLDRKIHQYVYCQSGQIMSASALLASNPRPTDTDIDDAMSGNICRCGTYVRERTGAVSSTPARQFVGGAGEDAGVSPDRYAGDACLGATRSDDTVPRKHTATCGSGHKETTRDTWKTEAND